MVSSCRGTNHIHGVPPSWLSHLPKPHLQIQLGVRFQYMNFGGNTHSINSTTLLWSEQQSGGEAEQEGVTGAPAAQAVKGTLGVWPCWTLS